MKPAPCLSKSWIAPSSRAVEGGQRCGEPSSKRPSARPRVQNGRSRASCSPAILTDPPLCADERGRSRAGRAIGRTSPIAGRPRGRRPPSAVRGWPRDRHRGHAAVGSHELARLLGHQPQHLLERVVGVEGQRGVREEGRQLARQLGLAAFEQGGLPGLRESALDHLERGEALEEEVAGRARDGAATSAASEASSERRQQRLLVGDGQVEHAELPAHRLARELVRDAERGLARFAAGTSSRADA